MPQGFTVDDLIQTLNKEMELISLSWLAEIIQDQTLQLWGIWTTL